MKAERKIVISLALALVMAVSMIPTSKPAEATYTPPFQTVKIGLFSYRDDGNIDQRNFPSANLEYASGKGEGYELGYYDGNRQFVPIGVQIVGTSKITVIMDRTMRYVSTSNSYVEDKTNIDDKTVGCIHLKLNASYPTYDEAVSSMAANGGDFVRYENDSFYVLRDQYTTQEDAAAAAGGMTDWTVDDGSSYTVTVVKTGTNNILFEYDCGSASSLAIRTFTTNGVAPQTWHRNCRYYGGFSFTRLTGGNITVVNYVDIDDYIKGVVPWEMSASWPREALKAQAITARTFLMTNITKHRTEGFDICNTIHCQAYHGNERATDNSDAAVTETAGQYLMYDGKLCETYYASSDGGATENVENIWGSNAIPYLRGVIDPYEAELFDSSSSYYWKKEFTPASLGAQIRSKDRSCGDIVKVSITFTELGNVRSITFIDESGKKNTFDKSNCRSAIGSGLSNRYTVNGITPYGTSSGLYVNKGTALDAGLDEVCAIGGNGAVEQLPSGDVYAISGKGTVSKLDVATTGTGTSRTVTTGVNAQGKFVFTGSGHGHNVGMSQWGAYSMAKYHNKTCEDILTFYYTGSQVVSA